MASRRLVGEYCLRSPLGSRVHGLLSLPVLARPMVLDTLLPEIPVVRTSIDHDRPMQSNYGTARSPAAYLRIDFRCGTAISAVDSHTWPSSIQEKENGPRRDIFCWNTVGAFSETSVQSSLNPP